MRLNLQKCAFVFEAGKFLGFILTHQGIEVNLDKYRAILEMRSLTLVKEVYYLTGRIASLSRFMAALAWKTLPIFCLLRKESTFKWMPECEAMFIEFKKISFLPIDIKQARI